MSTNGTEGRALRIVDDATSEARRGNLWLAKSDVKLYELPDFSETEAVRRAAFGEDILSRIRALDVAGLPPELHRSVLIARHNADIWAREAEWWWLACDPMRVGFFSLFAPTAYAGGFLLNVVHRTLAEFRFRTSADVHRYVALLADYGRLLDQFTARTRGQAERGIRMPKAQFDRAVLLFGSLREAAPATLRVAPGRLTETDADVSSRLFEDALAAFVSPAYRRLLDFLNDAYRSAAPEAVGMSQYPQGAEIYAELVKLHTTLALSPEEIHARGLERIRALDAAKLELARFAGFASALDYERALDGDDRWRATSPEAIASVFRRALDRIEPELPALFDVLPVAGVAAVPLPAEVSSSMTFGYYQQPSQLERRGTYFFNAANLAQRGLQNVAALTYHELIPGHHLHVATQTENEALPELRSRTFVNAYNEGWAEYAATLAGELGMYATPEERYGRLMMDSFLSCRLVVDTGMNAFGWSLERAREYLRQNGGMSEAEVSSETIRYSCDIPAQALAYKLGDDFLVALREEMRERLGERFDIRDFHAAVLEPGGRPYGIVAADVRSAEPKNRSAPT